MSRFFSIFPKILNIKFQPQKPIIKAFLSLFPPLHFENFEHFGRSFGIFQNFRFFVILSANNLALTFFVVFIREFSFVNRLRMEYGVLNSKGLEFTI